MRKTKADEIQKPNPIQNRTIQKKNFSKFILLFYAITLQIIAQVYNKHL